MSTITAVRRGGRVALAADALTTFEDTKLPPAYDAAPEKIIRVGEGPDAAYIGIVGYTAHFLVLQEALATMRDADFTSRAGLFRTFRALHPVLKDDYFLRPEAEEGDPYESSQVSVLVASPWGIFGVYDLREVHEYERFWAMGSGMPYALGAMYARWDDPALDAEALAAVGAAAGAEFDRSSGLPVQAVSLALAEGPPPVRPAPARKGTLRTRRRS